MGNVLIIDEGTAAQTRIKALISGYFENANIHILGAMKAVQSLSRMQARLIVFILAEVDSMEQTLIAEIRSASGNRPLIVYGRFTRMPKNVSALLLMGVNGLLSMDAPPSEHIEAINAVTRGGSYVDIATKKLAIAVLWGAHPVKDLSV